MPLGQLGELLPVALAHAPASILITTAAGRIVYVNPEFERITGYAASEAVGRTPAILKSGKHDAEVYRRMWAALKEARTWKGELVNRRKSGELYAAELTISPVRDAAGKVQYYVGSHRDITRERALRTVLEDHARELAQLRAEQDEFVANVGLALAEPLAELSRACAAPGPAGRERGAELARALATRVDELRELHRVGREHALFTRVELDEVLAELQREQAGRLAWEALPPVFGNRTLIRELFRLLVAQALQHGGPASRVSVRGSETSDAPGYLEITVVGEGAPIPESDRERIFSPFFRGNNGENGTALALCRKIAERHGGRIRASAVSRGSELCVTLPSAGGRLALERDVTAARFHQTPLEDGVLRVLLVESDPIGAERIVAGIGPGAVAETAATAAEALARVAEAPPDAVLVATDLPDAGGLELLERLRRSAPAVPVLMVTGAGDERLAVLAMQLGAADYVTHEEVPAVLRRAVLAAVQKARAARELEAARGDLIGIVTHDLKNPLSNILSYTDLILDSGVALPPEAQRHLLRIRENGSFMFELIHDILETQRIECGKLKLVATREDLRQLVRAAVDRTAFLASDKGCTITAVLPDEPLWAPVDARKIGQVLNNLLSNAVKFSPAGAPVEIGARAGADAVEVWVRDRGVGIAPAERELLFKKFSRTSARPTRGEKSTGLGLYIVQEILKLHGGEVQVESSPGQGSTFWCRVPSAA